MTSGPCQNRNLLNDEGYTSRHQTTVLESRTESCLLASEDTLSYFLAIDTSDRLGEDSGIRLWHMSSFLSKNRSIHICGHNDVFASQVCISRRAWDNMVLIQPLKMVISQVQHVRADHIAPAQSHDTRNQNQHRCYVLTNRSHTIWHLRGIKSRDPDLL